MSAAILFLSLAADGVSPARISGRARLPARALVLLAVVAVVGAAAQTNDQTTNEQRAQPELPAEQVYKNIQVFKGLPNTQLMSAMFFMEGSLQVSCGHCHLWEDFSKDDKPAKRTAREMIRMVRELNERQFQGRQMVSCNTCHRGQSPPAAPLPFAQIGSGSQVKDPALPEASLLFERHLKAIGGRAALEKIRSRVMKGTRSSSEGWSSPVEIVQEAPNKWRDSFTLKAQFTNVFDGAEGWGEDNHGVHPLNHDDLAGIQQDAEFYRDLKLGELFRDARTAGRGKIDSKDSYLVEAASAKGDRRQLYFDVESGLLVRIVRYDSSPFGPIPNAVDYADYRKVNGVLVPFTIGHLRPDYSLMDKIVSVEQNVPIAQGTFAKPSGPN